MAGDPYPQDGQTLTNQTPTGKGFFGSGANTGQGGGPPPPPAPPPMSQQDVWRQRTSYGGSFNGANDATNRYQGMGQAAAMRGAYQQDYGNSDFDRQEAYGARQQQEGALSLQRDAALGNQPSQAQLLGRNMIDQSLQAQMAGAASARGGSLAQAAAMRSAQQGAAVQQQQGVNNLSAMRAQEMAQARDSYMQGASGMRGQDFGQQGLDLQTVQQQTQNEQFQRQLNQQGQMGYEQMGQQAQEDQMKSAMGEHQIAEAGHEKQADVGQHSQDRATGVIGSVVGAAGSVGGSIAGIFSDVRAKTDVRPMGGEGVTLGALPFREGYADARRGQAGYMFGTPQEPDTGLAPGTADYQHAMGGGPGLDGRGVDAAPPPPPGAQKPGFWEALGSGMKGGAKMFSDENTKIGSGMPSLASIGKPQLGGMDDTSLSMANGNVMSNINKENDMLAGSMTGSGGMASHLGPDRSGAGKPGGGLSSLFSDEGAKDVERPLPLRAPEGKELHINNEGRGEVRDVAEPTWGGASLSGPTPRYSLARAAEESRKAKGPAERKPSLDELSAWARAETERTRARTEALRDQAPAVGRSSPMAEANRALVPSEYRYRPEFTPPDQAPGERNVGPMAQNMARDPVASTAVYRDPQTGMLAIDRDKALKLSLGSVGALQAQVDQQQAELQRLRGKRGR